MRPVHVGLAVIILAVFAVGFFEPRPRLDDPDGSAGEVKGWDKRVHLAYWEKWGSFERDACQAMVDEFNRSQDRIFVHYINTGEPDRKGILAIMGGDPPDVIGLWDRNVPPFAEAGALIPLDDLMQKSGLPYDYYIDNYLKLGQYYGKTYALPTTPGTVALFYNKEHFRRKAAALRAAGLDPDRAPRTIEELDRYAAVLTEMNPDGSPKIMGFLPTEPGWFNPTWGGYFGGKLYDEKTGKVTTDCPENVRAFTWVKSYAERYGRDKTLQFTAGLNFDSPYNAFIDGKVSMEMQGVWFPNFIRRHRPTLDFGVAPFPCAEGVAGPRSEIEADVIGIPRGCKHPKEAWEFVCWVQKHGLVILNRLQGKHLPLRVMPEEFRQNHPNPALELFAQLAAAPNSFRAPSITIWQEYRDEMDRAVQHIWNWPVPEDQLKGLTGEARQQKIHELCQAEVQRYLGELREELQAKLDQHNERLATEGGRAQP